MNLENQKIEAPLEKDKSLKVEKESKDQVGHESENFGINEAIAEGEVAVKKMLENISQENEAALAQVENYPGSDAHDVEEAKRVIADTDKAIYAIVENSDKKIGEGSLRYE
jgi:hypothetical protein